MRDKCFRMSNYCPLKKPYSDTLFVGLLVRSKTLGFGRNGPFGGPSFFETTGDSVVIHSINTRPLSNGFAFAVHRIKNISRHIVRLFLLSGPPTVFWRIITTIINSIQRVFFRRSFAKVFYKINITVLAQPSVAYLNSFAAVMLISPIRSFMTSVTHRMVRTICKPTTNRATMFIPTVVFPFISTLYTALTRVVIKQVFIANKRIPTRTLDSVLLADHIGNRQNTICNHLLIISNNRGRIKEDQNANK
jgi:hypothetical protein